MKYWTTNELRFVRDNLKLRDKEIGQVLGRSELSVRMARYIHQIKKHSRISADEVQVIERTMHLPATEAAEMLGRSVSTIRRLRRCIRNG